MSLAGFLSLVGRLVNYLGLILALNMQEAVFNVQTFDIENWAVVMGYNEERECMEKCIYLKTNDYVGICL